MDGQHERKIKESTPYLSCHFCQILLRLGIMGIVTIEPKIKKNIYIYNIHICIFGKFEELKNVSKRVCGNKYIEIRDELDERKSM